LFEAIRDCADLLERYGGHRQAAGLEIRPENIDAFRTLFDARARAVLQPEDLISLVHVDLEIELSELTAHYYDLLRHFGPFGIGNPAPTFVARSVGLAAPPRPVGDGHVRLLLEQGGVRMPAIGFGFAARLGGLQAERDRLDVAFHLHDDPWRDRRRLQAKLIDALPAT
jgi:single-stranded-DNA-specific exonuclease